MKITRNPSPKQKPDVANLGFGLHFTDHMLRVDYANGQWAEPTIVPYGPITLDPAAAVLHYSQTLFEGFKAYRSRQDAAPRLFRPQANLERLNRSAERLCMPQVDTAATLEAMKELIRLEQDWVPDAPGTALYVRPFMIATESFLGVRPANQYSLFTILTPVGAYFGPGATVRIWVEEEYVRAAKGGVGGAKTGGNYAASLLAAEKAKARGYQQVLWMDANHEFIEEVGTMNVFFVVGDKLITPPLNGSLLAGVTRDSILKMAAHLKLHAEERPIRMSELRDAWKAGQLKEAFGSGTAAVISPIGELAFQGDKLIPGDGKIGPVALKIVEAHTGITSGRDPDPFGWMVRV